MKRTLKCVNVLLVVIVGVSMLISLCACTSSTVKNSSAPTISATIKKDAKFDSVNLSAGPDDFANAGFSLGDSCDVEFGNGLVLHDVPYFNGFYVKTGAPVIVAYPNNDYITIAYNNRNLWTSENLQEGDTAKITMFEKGKYLTTQEALSQSYSVNRSDYSTDEQFSNFRALNGGNLKENFLFRGASPVDDSRGRAAITDSLIERAQIKTVIDLADTEEEIVSYFASPNFTSTYVKSLYDAGEVAALGMGSNQDSQEYKDSLAKGLRLLLQNGGPAYIHCMEGKDRTGFVCFLVEAFAGANYDEMRADYMQTYSNYYGITEASDPAKYNAVCSLYFDAFCEYLAGTSNSDELKLFHYEQSANNYLTSCGLTAEELLQLLELLEVH